MNFCFREKKSWNGKPGRKNTFLKKFSNCKCFFFLRFFVEKKKKTKNKNFEMASQKVEIKMARFENSPWGFRVHGGTDFGAPLTIQKVRKFGNIYQFLKNFVKLLY